LLEWSVKEGHEPYCIFWSSYFILFYRFLLGLVVSFSIINSSFVEIVLGIGYL